MKNLIPIAEGKALNTAADAKDYFHKHGIAVNGWCRDHGLSRNVVKNLLTGRGKGVRGAAHEAAIALGMKFHPDCLPQNGTGVGDSNHPVAHTLPKGDSQQTTVHPAL